MKQRLRKKLLKNFDIHVARLYPDVRKTEAIIAMLHRTVVICHSYKNKRMPVFRSDSHKAYIRLKLMKLLRYNVLIKN